MLVDGITLAAGSGLGIQMLDDSRRGPQFPSLPANGSLWELTQAVGNQPAGIYEYSRSIWSLRSPQYSLLTYDLSGTVFGSPEAGQRVMLFVAPRSFVIQGGFAGAIAKALQPSTSTQEFSIVHTPEDGSANFVGTIVFQDGNDTAEFQSNSMDDILVKRGETIVVFAPQTTDPALADISITLCGFISA